MIQTSLDRSWRYIRPEVPLPEDKNYIRKVPLNRPPVPRFHHFQIRSDPDTYHEAILRCLYPIRSLTVKEMAVETGITVKMVTYKLKELRIEAMVEKDCPRVCTISGKRARCYRLI